MFQTKEYIFKNNILNVDEKNWNTKNFTLLKFNASFYCKDTFLFLSFFLLYNVTF